jgi:hypothetical protein
MCCYTRNKPAGHGPRGTARLRRVAARDPLPRGARPASATRRRFRPARARRCGECLRACNHSPACPAWESGRPGICTNRICSVTNKLLTKTVDTALRLFCPDCPFSMQLACFAIFLALDGFAVNSQRRWHRAIKLAFMPDIHGTIGGRRSGNNGACIACLQLWTICPSQTPSG